MHSNRLSVEGELVVDKIPYQRDLLTRTVLTGKCFITFIFFGPAALTRSGCSFRSGLLRRVGLAWHTGVDVIVKNEQIYS
jgi:hypothetical protein